MRVGTHAYLDAYVRTEQGIWPGGSQAEREKAEASEGSKVTKRKQTREIKTLNLSNQNFESEHPLCRHGRLSTDIGYGPTRRERSRTSKTSLRSYGTR
eukprot:68819-Rhodomonas_salina.1